MDAPVTSTALKSFLDMSSPLVVKFKPDEADGVQEKHHFLSCHQGSKYAITHVHTAEEKAKFRKLVLDLANNRFNDYGSRRSSPDYLKLCKYWCSLSNGINIFYKTPEQLKAYHNKRIKAKQINDAIEDNQFTITTMTSQVQNPARSVAIAGSSRIAPPSHGFPTTRTVVQPVSQEASVVPVAFTPGRFRFLVAAPPRPQLIICPQLYVIPSHINQVARQIRHRQCRMGGVVGSPGGDSGGLCRNA